MDERMMKAENIIFDIGKVLLTFSPEKVCELIPKDVRQDIYQAMFVPIDGHSRWEQFDLGAIPNAEIAKEIAEAAGHPEHANSILYALENFPFTTMEEKELVQLLPTLKAMGKKLYCLTNYAEPAFSNTLKRFSFFEVMDGFVVSAREKMVKPDDAIFQKILKKYALKPEKTLFIDDREENVESAARNGLMTWHYTE